jgi:hypothetical protein
MKLSKFRESYYTLSGKASDVCRNLSFAGVAICWVFKYGEPIPKLPKELLLPLAIFAIGLAFDLLHYLIATALWGSFTRINEKRFSNKSTDPDVKASKYMNWPALIFFWSKAIAVCIGYVFIIIYIIRQWVFS